ncbi:uncharacterized protein LOC117148391 [Drosophila mauritiana]|uniref:Uncharacterized protein LOC117148391 n=1 Tax=Drosophila mauritiana TaxID=7226 RepID=A0A6P8L7A0_DROMA|nr:uncharacterized protein LOC117148391 [Drosophila mauritiana]XP_033171646.1 uncharacterized protein LOC117148391 [Drosophila mauritiana]
MTKIAGSDTGSESSGSKDPKKTYPESIYHYQNAQTITLGSFIDNQIFKQAKKNSGKSKRAMKQLSERKPMTPTEPLNPIQPVNPKGQQNPMGPVNPMDQEILKESVDPMGQIKPIRPLNPMGQWNSMEANPSGQMNSKGPMTPLSQMKQMGPMNPIGQINPMVTPKQNGQIYSMSQMNPMGQLNSMSQMNPMDQMNPMEPGNSNRQMNPMGIVNPNGQMNSMSQMNPMDDMNLMRGPVNPNGQIYPMELGNQKGQINPMWPENPNDQINPMWPENPNDQINPIWPENSNDQMNPMGPVNSNDQMNSGSQMNLMAKMNMMGRPVNPNGQLNPMEAGNPNGQINPMGPVNPNDQINCMSQKDLIDQVNLMVKMCLMGVSVNPNGQINPKGPVNSLELLNYLGEAMNLLGKMNTTGPTDPMKPTEPMDGEHPLLGSQSDAPPYDDPMTLPIDLDDDLPDEPVYFDAPRDLTKPLTPYVESLIQTSARLRRNPLGLNFIEDGDSSDDEDTFANQTLKPIGYEMLMARKHKENIELICRYHAEQVVLKTRAIAFLWENYRSDSTLPPNKTIWSVEPHELKPRRVPPNPPAQSNPTNSMPLNVTAPPTYWIPNNYPMQHANLHPNNQSAPATEVQYLNENWWHNANYMNFFANMDHILVNLSQMELYAAQMYTVYGEAFFETAIGRYFPGEATGSSPPFGQIQLQFMERIRQIHHINKINQINQIHRIQQHQQSLQFQQSQQFQQRQQFQQPQQQMQQRSRNYSSNLQEMAHKMDRTLPGHRQMQHENQPNMRYSRAGEQGPLPGRFAGGEQFGGCKPNPGLNAAKPRFNNMIKSERQESDSDGRWC